MNIMFDEQQAMLMALNISGNHVMCFNLKENRVYDLHGPDDCEKFRSFIRRLSDGTDMEAECHYRWNYNYTGQGEPDWHDMYVRAMAEYEDGKVVNIIATINDETAIKQKEREVELVSERYRSIFENSIIGMSFYTPEGWLMDANRIMRKLFVECHSRA